MQIFDIPNPYPKVRRVFVYGTLRKSDSNDITKLIPSPVYIGNSQISGNMYHLGGYPGVTLGGANVIVGEVYAITEPLERLLDGIESEYPAQADEYDKRDIQVLVNNQMLDCIVYEINTAYIQGKPQITNGDWVKSRE
jgi:gamma-glutamylcyclotransferase (GGCT)/AIG2-like uncharacterized protein YtfP